MNLEFPLSFYRFAAQRALSDINLLWFDDGTIKAGIKFVPGTEEVGFPRHFGRDMNFFGWQTLHIWPESTRAILEFLFKHQGTKIDLVTGEQPGKDLHEHETNRRHPTDWPDTVYFALDSTPLTIITTFMYYTATDDRQFVEDHWPNLLAALNWIDRYGDIDGDGFVEYQSTNKLGLLNQAWKDSHVAYCHRNGVPAETPIAPAEVQGWVYLAKNAMAYFALYIMEDLTLADKLLEQAETLKRRFNEKFWMKDRQFVSLGLDANKDQIKTLTSNAGQVLASGILDDDKAAKVVRRMMKHDMLTPWGIRTLSTLDKHSYDPNSYHNGSIWPYDNWLCSIGFRRYGFNKEAELVMNRIFRAVADLGHIPELFVVRTRGKLYSIHRYVRQVEDEDELEHVRREQAESCVIQAWSAGAIIHWLTAGKNPILTLADLGLGT